MSTENISSLCMIETDGNVVSHARDPPGQRSVYIVPGDTFREIYRLATYKDFPRQVLQDPRQLAANGFFFTGYRDRVKCFSCGQQTENWLPEDDPSSSQWHTVECDFYNKRDDMNVPINALYARFEVTHNNNLRPTQGRQPFERPSAPSHQNGFQVETVSHVVQTSAHINQQRTPQRPEVQVSSQRRNTAAVSSGNAPQTSSHANQFEEVFPCRHPINPHMRSAEARLQTFLDHASDWPAFRIRASPREIVEAGMYYLGERDRVKCWYCNGGLQNWELNDNPWNEHAKWFPMCEFVLQKKGPQFVHGIVAQFPNLRRPMLANPSNSFQINLPDVQPSFRSIARSSQNSSSSNPEIVDPRKERELRNKKIANDIKSSNLVSQAKMMGFSDKEIEAALKKQYEQFDVGFSNFESLVEALLSSNGSETPTESGPSVSQEPPTANEPVVNGEQELRELENQRTCKVCHREAANVVFIPCGHLVSCNNCSVNIKQCPTCHTYIRQKVRSYLS